MEQRLYYGVKDQELLDEKYEDTVATILGETAPADFPVQILEFAPMKFWKNEKFVVSNILDGLLEELDDEYGSSHDTPTENMVLATKELVKVIKREYNVWTCEPTGNIFEVSKTGDSTMVRTIQTS